MPCIQGTRLLQQEKIASGRREQLRLQAEIDAAVKRYEDAEVLVAKEQTKADIQRETYTRSMEEWQRERAAYERKV